MGWPDGWMSMGSHQLREAHLAVCCKRVELLRHSYALDTGSMYKCRKSAKTQNLCLARVRVLHMQADTHSAYKKAWHQTPNDMHAHLM
jgi:hypothetical protein